MKISDKGAVGRPPVDDVDGRTIARYKRMSMLRALRTAVFAGRERAQLRSLSAEHDHSLWYQQNTSTLLHELLDHYGSDKGSCFEASPYYPWRPHSYANVYASLLEHCRFHVETIFECGVGTNRAELMSNMSTTGRPGASLRAWRDYFPNARILGADIDSSILFEEDRIETFFVDQTKPASIQRMWHTAGYPILDVAIDDGLHTPHAARTLLRETWDLLRAGGLYFIEDVPLRLLHQHRSYLNDFPGWVSFVILPHRDQRTVEDNVLIIVRKGPDQPGLPRSYRT